LVRELEAIPTFEIYLPVAKTTVNAVLIIGLGGLIGFLSGMFGVGGGFLLTPLLITIGISPPVAAASSSNQLIGTSCSGALAHRKLGNVDIKLGTIILVGGVVGSSVGVQVIRLLREIGNVDFFITLTYVVVLGGIGFFMLKESYASLKNGASEGDAEEGIWTKLRQTDFPLKMHFSVSKIDVSALFPFLLGFLTGFLAAIMGVGGGFVMMPAMIYILGMPTTVAIGTDLFQIVLVQVNTVIQQAYVNQTVDIVLAFALLLGSTVGAQIGARMTRRFNAPQLRFLLGAIVIIVFLKLLLDLLLEPSSLIVAAGGGGGPG
jgi:hypothetical protein